MCATGPRWPDTGLMLAERRRWWANISPALGDRVVFGRLNSHRQRHTDSAQRWEVKQHVSTSIEERHNYANVAHLKFISHSIFFVWKTRLKTHVDVCRGPSAVLDLLPSLPRCYNSSLNWYQFQPSLLSFFKTVKYHSLILFIYRQAMKQYYRKAWPACL